MIFFPDDCDDSWVRFAFAATAAGCTIYNYDLTVRCADQTTEKTQGWLYILRLSASCWKWLKTICSICSKELLNDRHRNPFRSKSILRHEKWCYLITLHFIIQSRAVLESYYRQMGHPAGTLRQPTGWIHDSLFNVKIIINYICK